MSTIVQTLNKLDAGQMKFTLQIMLCTFCLIHISANAQDNVEAKEKWLSKAYERGAYLVKELAVDTDWPLIWLEVEGQASLMILDTGASNFNFVQEKFDNIITPIEATQAKTLNGIRQQIKPLNISLFPNSGRTFLTGISYSFSWEAWELPDFVEPFISGVTTALRWDDKIAAIQRDQTHGLIAFLPSPATDPYAQSTVFDIELVDNWAMIAKIPLLLNGSSEPRIFQLLIDTGSEGSIAIKRSELPNNILLNQLADETSSTILGLEEETPVLNGHLPLGSGLIEVSINAVSEFSVFSGISHDGVIGSSLLNRFNYIIDAEAGKLILDLNEIEFDDPSAPDTSRLDNIRSRLLPYTAPTPTWSGYIVLQPNEWGYQYGLQERDIIFEVDNQRISHLNFDTLGQELGWSEDPIEICWARPLSENPSPSDYETYCHIIDIEAMLAPFKQADTE